MPRPAIWVDTVIAPWAPASATMAASWASFLALSTVHAQPGAVELAGEPLGLGDVERADQDGPPGGVRRRRPRSTTASSFSSTVGYSRSGSSARTHGRFGGITAISRP